MLARLFGHRTSDLVTSCLVTACGHGRHPASALLPGMVGTAHAQGQARRALRRVAGGCRRSARASWVIDISDDQYTAAASGATTGLLRVFASGQGSGAARGYVSSGRLIPSAYASSVTADTKTEELRITLAGGNVKDYAVESADLRPIPDRIPVTDAHRRGVTDPDVSSALARVAGTGNPVSPEACNRTLPVFDGRLRYDVKLAYKRMENVKADKGYEGPVVVCAMYFTPISGYIPGTGRDQVPDRPARHGDLAGADRRHPRAGAVPHLDPHAARRRRAGSDPVRHDRTADARIRVQHQDPIAGIDHPRRHHAVIKQLSLAMTCSRALSPGIWWPCRGIVTICGKERNHIRGESPIRSRFVQDSFPTVKLRSNLPQPMLHCDTDGIERGADGCLARPRDP